MGPARVYTAASWWSVPCHGRDPRVHGCEGETRSGNARGGLADPADGQRPGWVVNSDWMGSLREHVCETLRDLCGVFCSQNAQRRLWTGRAHVRAWRTPRIARFVFGPGNGSLTLTHLVVLLVVVVVVVLVVLVVLGLTLFEKSLRLLHVLFKFLQISSHNPL